MGERSKGVEPELDVSYACTISTRGRECLYGRLLSRHDKETASDILHARRKTQSGCVCVGVHSRRGEQGLGAPVHLLVERHAPLGIVHDR
jgi:hypothetical protein